MKHIHYFENFSLTGCHNSIRCGLISLTLHFPSGSSLISVCFSGFLFYFLTFLVHEFLRRFTLKAQPDRGSITISAVCSQNVLLICGDKAADIFSAAFCLCECDGPLSRDTILKSIFSKKTGSSLSVKENWSYILNIDKKHNFSSHTWKHKITWNT